MKVVEGVTLCLLVCAVGYCRANDENLANEHSIIKRQAQDIHSPSLPRQHFVSPDGEPYFKYQPPVSSSRETVPGRQASSQDAVPSRKEATARVQVGGGGGGRQATTRVQIGGAAGGRASSSSGSSDGRRKGSSNPLLGRLRGRTYNYPFGKERVQYTGSQPQGYINETQTGGDNNGGNSAVVSQQDTPVQQQQQQQEQQQRYNSLHGRPSLRSAGNYQNDSSQTAPSQDASEAALYQQEYQRRRDELQRREEDQRRHEEDRRRHEEDRRKLIEERRKKNEERRRLYYEQQKLRSSQPRGNVPDLHGNRTVSQQPGSHGNRQQGATTATNTQQRAADSNQPTTQYAERTGTNTQQGYQQSLTNQQAASSVSQNRGHSSQHQQPVYDGSRQGGYLPRQSAYSGSQQSGSPPQQSAYSGSQQSGSPPQQSAYSGSQQSGSPPQQSAYSGSQQSGSPPQQRANSGSQQSGYLPQHQQSPYSGSQHAAPQHQQHASSRSLQHQTSYSGPQQGGYLPQRQQFVSSSAQRNPDGQPVFGLNNTHSRNAPSTPQQPDFSHFYYQQPGQVDPRLQSTTRSNFSNARSNTDYTGQGQRQRYQYPGTGANLGSSFSYEQQDTDLDCPDTGIDLRINGLDCQQAVQQFGSYLCYTHEFTSRDCCQVCRPRKQITRTGCEYGDHAELCSSIAPADCYDLRNRYSCCETCERLKRHNLPAGCEYGDMTTRCDNVRQNPGLCYVPDNQRLCCETCNQIRNLTNTGCPWGDYHSNLCQLFDENTSNIRINCYSRQRQKLCCQSCERLREWIPADLPPDCQYGDRPVIFTTTEFGRLNCSTLFSYFSQDECRINEAVATNCCHTCHRLLHSRG